MRWTRWIAGGAVAGLLLGCAYGYRTVSVRARYSVDSRPHPSYYCYDCHGYRFFDPYYDWCVAHGFHYRWNKHPAVVALYRARYVRIKESHPSYGRYRYQQGYRSSGRYAEGRDYDAWRNSGPGARGEREIVRERGRDREQQSMKRGRKPRDLRERKDSRERKERERSKEGKR